jgi:hypothetical protein
MNIVDRTWVDAAQRGNPPALLTLERLDFQSEWNPHTFLIHEAQLYPQDLRVLYDYQMTLPGFHAPVLPVLQSGACRLVSFTTDNWVQTLKELQKTGPNTLFWLPSGTDLFNVASLACTFKHGNHARFVDGQVELWRLGAQEGARFHLEKTAREILDRSQSGPDFLIDRWDGPTRDSFAAALRYVMEVFDYRMAQFEADEVHIITLGAPGEDSTVLGPYWTLAEAQAAYREIQAASKEAYDYV